MLSQLTSLLGLAPSPRTPDALNGGDPTIDFASVFAGADEEHHPDELEQDPIVGSDELAEEGDSDAALVSDSDEENASGQLRDTDHDALDLHDNEDRISIPVKNWLGAESKAASSAGAGVGPDIKAEIPPVSALDFPTPQTRALDATRTVSRTDSSDRTRGVRVDAVPMPVTDPALHVDKSKLTASAHVLTGNVVAAAKQSDERAVEKAESRQPDSLMGTLPESEEGTFSTTILPKAESAIPNAPTSKPLLGDNLDATAPEHRVKHRASADSSVLGSDLGRKGSHLDAQLLRASSASELSHAGSKAVLAEDSERAIPPTSVMSVGKRELPIFQLDRMSADLIQKSKDANSAALSDIVRPVSDSIAGIGDAASAKGGPLFGDDWSEIKPVLAKEVPKALSESSAPKVTTMANYSEQVESTEPKKTSLMTVRLTPLPSNAKLEVASLAVASPDSLASADRSPSFLDGGAIASQGTEIGVTPELRSAQRISVGSDRVIGMPVSRNPEADYISSESAKMVGGLERVTKGGPDEIWVQAVGKGTPGPILERSPNFYAQPPVPSEMKTDNEVSFQPVGAGKSVNFQDRVAWQPTEARRPRLDPADKSEIRILDGQDLLSKVNKTAPPLASVPIGSVDALPTGRARVTSPILVDFIDDSLPPEAAGAGAFTEVRTGTAQTALSTMPAMRPDMAATLRQVADGMARLGEGSVEIRLSPEELGQVRMQLVTGETGMTVHVSAERQDTLDLLRRNIDQLARDLADAGYDGASFTFSEGDGGKRDGQPRTDPDRAPHVSEDQHTTQSPVAMAATDGLDLRF